MNEEDDKMKIEQYSLGIGDRFGAEGAAQLRALQQAASLGVQIVPVWNKSNREHSIIGTSPGDTRREADEAVKACGWTGSYYVDADHIGIGTVDRFLDSSNFFTIDVADFIGKTAEGESMAQFLRAMAAYKGSLKIPGLTIPVVVSNELLEGVAWKYLAAVEEAGRVYRHIAEAKGEDSFVPEISVDEANSPQTPAELFFILAAIARERIPIQTIAPKFTGSFLKGIDYVGDISQFTKEFEDDLAVLAFAQERFKFPANLKLSVHSGSDKFSLYSIMHRAIKKSGAGLHVKTAGTTWLEELIGLAASDGDGLLAAKEVYRQSYQRYDELCQPYLTVIDIDKGKLPSPEVVAGWSKEDYIQALQHDQSNRNYNVNFRQLVHVGYKVAAEMGERFAKLLRECRSAVEENVTYNLFERHIRPIFIGEGDGGEQRHGKQKNASSVAQTT